MTIMKFYKILTKILIASILLLSVAVASNNLSDQSQILGNSLGTGDILEKNYENGFKDNEKIIISIDSSNSMVGNKLSEVKTFSNIFAKKALLKGAEIGVVGWNDDIAVRLSPSSKFDNIYRAINNIIAEKNTCIGNGLNESINLLEMNTSNNLKYIVFLSDGEENCSRLENPCLDAIRAKNLGIKIFSIIIGPTNRTDPLECLTDTTGGEKFYLNNIGKLGDIYNNLVANASIIGVKETTTNVTVEKLVEYNEKNSTPKIILKIATPPIDKMDIVISLDSSGSMGLSNSDTLVKAGLKNSINNFIGDLKGKNISSRIAVVSWDDNVDFIYGNNGTAISGINPNKTILASATAFQKDLGPNIIPFYKSAEEETTDLSIGIVNPLDILRNNNPLHPSAFRCIVLIAGRGEFKNYTPNVANKVKSLPFRIYPLGLNPGQEMEKSLRNLAYISNGKYIYSTGAANDFSQELDNLFKEFLKEAAYNTSVARNVIIYDSLYPYLKPDLSSLKGAKLLGYNSTTNTLAMEIVGGMLGGHTYEVSFDTPIALELPLDVSRKRTAIGYQISNQVPISNITYQWHTNKIYTIDLPENQITIKNARASPSSFGILSMLSLLFAFQIRRIMKW
jgi:hypothetical protein